MALKLKIIKFRINLIIPKKSMIDCFMTWLQLLFNRSNQLFQAFVFAVEGHSANFIHFISFIDK